jgi:hypothetical protein
MNGVIDYIIDILYYELYSLLRGYYGVWVSKENAMIVHSLVVVHID